MSAKTRLLLELTARTYHQALEPITRRQNLSLSFAWMYFVFIAEQDRILYLSQEINLHSVNVESTQP